MRRAALAAVFALAALAASLAVGTEPAPAHHDQGEGSGRGPHCYMQPDPDNPNKPGVRGDVCAVARNLVGDVGTPSKPIDVCAEPNYRASTQEAVRLLNDAGFGRTLFAWVKGGTPKCGHELTSGRVSSIVVTDNYESGGRHPASCSGRGWACAIHYTVRDDPDYGYVGQAEVRVHPHLDVVTQTRQLLGIARPRGTRSARTTTPRPRRCGGAPPRRWTT